MRSENEKKGLVLNLVFGHDSYVLLSQLDSLALEHDINSLRRECDEKDATIKELSTYLRSSEVLSSKVSFFTVLAVHSSIGCYSFSCS